MEAKRPKFKDDFYIPVPSYIFDDLENSSLTLNGMLTYILLLRQVDFETGIWNGCGKKLELALDGQLSGRTMLRTLEELEEKGYVKRFPKKKGARGNYPVLIHKYPVRFGPQDGRRLNALKTTDLKNPVYERDGQNPDMSPPDHRQISDTSSSPVASIPDIPDAPDVPDAPDLSRVTERETSASFDGQSPSQKQRAGQVEHSGYLPFQDMQQAVMEETGYKVFFPPEHHGRYRELVRRFSKSELIHAIRESCGQIWRLDSFDYRLFSAFFLDMASQILGAYRLCPKETGGLPGDHPLLAI
jgi:hypothetical protein